MIQPICSTTADTMIRMLTASWLSRALYTAAKLGIADAMKAAGGRAVSVAELAAQLHVDSGALRRLLRALASVGVFCTDGDPSGWHFGLTPLAEHLVSDAPGSLRHAAVMYGEEMALSWHELPAVVEDGMPAWDRVLGVDHFSYYRQNPQAASVFDRAMKELGKTLYGDTLLVQSYDFVGALGEGATVVDVGGGLGGFLATLLQGEPSLRGVLFDVSHVIEDAKRHHADMAVLGYQARLGFEVGNFFERVPGQADAYLLKRVLHDWDDERCVAILRNIREAMRPSGRILVAEAVLPQGDEEHFGKWLDLNMMVVTGGQERTRAEFATLFERAGLRLVDVHPSPSVLQLIEVARQN